MTFAEKYRLKDTTHTLPATSAAFSMETLKTAAEGQLAANAKEDYKAFLFRSEPQFDLWIRVNDKNESASISIPYSRRAITSHDSAFFLVIMQFDSGPVLSVRLHGRDLEELYMKILAHEAVYVREFDANRWPEVPKGEPIITGIDIRYRPLPQLKKDDEVPLPGETIVPEGTATH